MQKFKDMFMRGGWSITLACVAIGFMLTVQFRHVQSAKNALPNQRIEELSARLIQTEEDRDKLSEQLQTLKEETSKFAVSRELTDDLKFRACSVPLVGEGIVIKMDDSVRIAKAGENQNLYLIHDDDLLRVINELRAAGAEAISINGQRLIATSEIRCAGPTLSVNNVRSAPPYEISAIGEKKSLENAVKMRGGVAETLKVWGIVLEVKTADDVKIPAYSGSFNRVYAKIDESNKE